MPSAHEPLAANDRFQDLALDTKKTQVILDTGAAGAPARHHPSRPTAPLPQEQPPRSAPKKNSVEKEPTPMRSTPIRQATVNEGSATRLADADGGRRSVAPFRLRRYTAAASAAALGSAANAAIVTGGTVSSGEFATPLNGSTTPLDKSDFGNALNVKFSVSRIVEERRLKVAQDGNTAGSFQFLRTSAQNNATFNNKLILRRDAVGMGYGDVIDANAANTASYREWANSALLAWSSRSGVDWIGNSGEWRLDGYTPNSVRHYLAFRFTDDGGSTYQYGWMDVEWWGRQTNGDVELTIHGWAYNTAGSITAGFSGTAVPSGGGVLALAAGAAGLRGRRRGRN